MSKDVPSLDIYAPFPIVRGPQEAPGAPASPTVTKFLPDRTSNDGLTQWAKSHVSLRAFQPSESHSVKTLTAKAERRKKAKAARKAGIISRREAKKTGVWNIDKRIAIWATFMPIHLMWCAYMAELISLPPRPTPSEDGTLPNATMPNAEAMQSKLVRADLHGSIIKVKQSRNTSVIGSEGIVIHETENTFKLVTKKNALKIIPKENSIFTILIPLYAPPRFDPTALAGRGDRSTGPAPSSSMGIDADPSSATVSSSNFYSPSALESPLEREPSIQFELYGNHFRFRAADRASRKFKPKTTIEI
ncbi:Rof/RNase P-like protein [Cantharellus anzutake]|uniref:Rof/RNase P-like protein n=1 Tax=Cantharellus anzutake TaxID=1750568 RepID=UPI001906EFEF|nr:Rof/RNase P-like protein [Cantharellus anzutake]KAF8340437.1 Rof/RNase P-like protein [Cantharellus anzutake]